MRTYAEGPQRLRRLVESFHALQRDQALREEIQLALTPLNADAAAHVVEVLYDPQVDGPRHPRVILAWSVISIGLIAAMGAAVLPLPVAIPVLVVNVAVSARTATRRYRLLEIFRSMRQLVPVAACLGQIRTRQPVPQIEALAGTGAVRKRLARAFYWYSVLGKLPLGLGAWLNLLFPAEVLVCIHTVRRLPAVQQDLRALYELVGSLDAAIAVASFLQRTGSHCPAELDPDRLIEIEAGYHPLIADPVTNSLKLRERSALISGSNMAGKTTFIKMMGINLILGRTLGFCLARKARIPPAAVMACIRGEQSVESGKSRYFAEIETLLKFLRHEAAADSVVVIIDEPFSGTNTTERVTAAKAVLSALSRHSQVFATTHDVELQELLGSRFDMYHFTENPDIAGYFDYKLHSGPCYERNALRLLASVGFPSAVIEEANRLVAGHGASSRADIA